MTEGLRGSLSVEECLDAIARASHDTASLANGHFDAPVPSCPGWSVRDAIAHLIDVHRSWTRVAEHHLQTRVEEPAEPVADDELIARYLAGAERMVEVLREADQAAGVWTWAPAQQDIAFITRHQVQEALVHGWDVARARGAAWPLDPAVADDCVDEFLTFSLASVHYPKEGVANLGTVVTLESTDTGSRWRVEDGAPGTLRARRDDGNAPATLSAPSGDLLLWLYGRVELPATAHADVLGRLRDLAYTD